MRRLVINKISNDFDIEKICLMLDGYRIVTFDIYDTLVKRNVHSPADVFQLIEKKYNQVHTTKINGFSSERISAENRARIDSEYEEITLDEIYHELPYNVEVCDELKKIELNTEVSICSPNIELIDIYKKLLKRGKMIYLISDMYLPQETIQIICEKCNIKNYEKIYVSSEYRCRKKNSRLFKKFVELEHIHDSGEVMHIGDNFYSDYISARRAGLNAYMVPHYIKKINYIVDQCNGDEFSKKTINAFINNHIDYKNNYFYNMGYAVYGLLLYTFTVWLLENFDNEEIDRALFLARDSYILQKAFLYLSKNRYKNDYFYVSRKSTFGMRLVEDYSLKNIISKAHLRQEFLVEDFLKRIDVYTEKNINLAQEMNVKLDMPITIDRVNKDEELYKYLNAICFEMKDKFSASANMFENYTMQFVKSTKTIAIIDVGWNGTAQKAIDIVQHKNGLGVDVKGYYLGVNKEENGREKNIDVKGFLSGENSTEIQRIKLKAIMGLLEFFLSAPHGTTREYCKKEDKIVPKLEEYEYLNEKYVQNAFSDLQEGALMFVEDFNNWEFANKICITSEMAMQPLFALCKNAKKKELSMFGDLVFYEGILSPVAKPKKFYNYLFNAKQFKRDFGKSVWKLGFLKRLCNNMPLPYYQLYSILIKKYKK